MEAGTSAAVDELPAGFGEPVIGGPGDVTSNASIAEFYRASAMADRGDREFRR